MAVERVTDIYVSDTVHRHSEVTVMCVRFILGLQVTQNPILGSIGVYMYVCSVYCP